MFPQPVDAVAGAALLGCDRWRPRTVHPSTHIPYSYDRAERHFASLIEYAGLDSLVRRNPASTRSLELAIEEAISDAYLSRSAGGRHDAHRFLQRVLYRINRLMFFWFDELGRYENDRSLYLHALRARIESAWQNWERHNVSVSTQPPIKDVASALRDRTATDVVPHQSDSGTYFRDRASLSAYRRLLEITSLDGLVEASQLSRTLGGVGGPIHGTMTRLLLEEYGGGHLAKKHSAYFQRMLEALDMDATPEIYFDVVPWEVLANINHSFLLSDRRRLYLRYVGGLLYTETSVPAAFGVYLAAAKRLELPQDAMTYWALHIKEDARHGPWMLNEVALPLAERYPNAAWEIVLGYDQQRAMSARAGDATARACKAVE